MRETHDYQKEAEELRVIVDKASRVLPQYREQNKRLQELIEQNNKYYQQEINNLRSQSQKQESAHEHEIALLQGQLAAFRSQAEELQRCRNDLESAKGHLLKSRIICALLCAALVATGYTLSTRPSVSASHSSSLSASYSTSKPTIRPSKTPGTSGFSAVASSISSFSAAYVWIPRSGERYHDTKTCSNMKNPNMVTLQEAKRLGFTPCGRCHPPR